MKKHIFLQLLMPVTVLLILSLLELVCGTANVNWHDPLEDPVLELRAVRVLASLAVGAALAMAGMCFQAVLRNVLAEPFTLGISGGASVGAALAVILNLQVL
ncbi:MAG: iron chelate uptake ABC transporter family permease subunit, partial [Lentisphaeria bacterium]|nr:iron chelate uptake ABC transporter family permease subunit [Lentisphaeria bacterium]